MPPFGGACDAPSCSRPSTTAPPSPGGEPRSPPSRPATQHRSPRWSRCLGVGSSSARLPLPLCNVVDPRHRAERGSTSCGSRTVSSGEADGNVKYSKQDASTVHLEGEATSRVAGGARLRGRPLGHARGRRRRCRPGASLPARRRPRQRAVGFPGPLRRHARGAIDCAGGRDSRASACRGASAWQPPATRSASWTPWTCRVADLLRFGRRGAPEAAAESSDSVGVLRGRRQTADGEVGHLADGRVHGAVDGRPRRQHPHRPRRRARRRTGTDRSPTSAPPR